MLKIVLATRNPGKIAEMQSILSNSDIKGEVEIETLLSYPDLPEITEDGATFPENALKKAVTVARLTGHFAIADDSGLEVDALGGAPGVHSARFAGKGARDQENIKKLLMLLQGVPQEERTARFVCVIALASPDGEVRLVEGECRGYITTEERGTSGFGYDPLFIVPEYGKTFAELGGDIKNKISHRAIAIGKLYNLLKKLTNINPPPPPLIKGGKGGFKL
ncbi:MAG: XTP/dITP diphosphatase [Nitrospirae bacterium]|nr:XTP/dITP diphosphatase [Nitrospirota bacterium]